MPTPGTTPYSSDLIFVVLGVPVEESLYLRLGGSVTGAAIARPEAEFLLTPYAERRAGVEQEPRTNYDARHDSQDLQQFLHPRKTILPAVQAPTVPLGLELLPDPLLPR